MIRAVAALLVFLASSATAAASVPLGLDSALSGLTRQGKFSGAVVIRDDSGVRFAKGYGDADPFNRIAFTPDTPVDSGSLAKPLTAAAVLALARDGHIALDSPAVRYLPELHYADITVRHLLSHSAGLQLDETAAGLAGKSNLQLVASARSRPLLFKPGGGFTYCNLCTIALAEIVERRSGRDYLQLARAKLALPAGVRLRPARLADWQGRAIGYRRSPTGLLERADSYEGEAFYGAANLSISAAQLAEWGSRWWQTPLAAIRELATSPARIAGNPSGLTLGNWHCAPGGRRCHYLGHHEGFHHMLYWDTGRRLTVAMVSNNSLAPALQQRVQRALVAFAEGRERDASREIGSPLPDSAVAPGTFGLAGGENIAVDAAGPLLTVRRGGIDYPAYPVGAGIRYVPGLDLYLAGAADGRLHWLTLHEDLLGVVAERN